MNLLFWIVKNKANKRNEAPIYCRITIDGHRAEFSTGIFIPPINFDIKRHLIKGQSEDIKVKNAILEDVKHKLNRIYYAEILNNNNPSPHEIKDAYLNKRKQIVLLIDLLNEYSNEYFKAKGNKRIFDLFTRYINVIKTTLNEIQKHNITINQCDNEFFSLLTRYLIDNFEYSVSYTKKLIQFIKSTLKYAFNRRYIDRMIGADYKVPYRSNNEIVYLDEWEVNKIVDHQFCNESLQRSADLFIIQCYTGLAYADLAKLNASHFKRDNEGLMWINITREKVDSAECLIPVISKAMRVLKKYSFKLPIITNQKYNEALKKIATEVGIHKRLTTHVGRKTYGTLLLNKDVPIETVSKLLGHASIRMTQKHYAKVLHQKIAKDIRLIL